MFWDVPRAKIHFEKIKLKKNPYTQRVETSSQSAPPTQILHDAKHRYGRSSNQAAHWLFFDSTPLPMDPVQSEASFRENLNHENVLELCCLWCNAPSGMSHAKRGNPQHISL